MQSPFRFMESFEVFSIVSSAKWALMHRTVTVSGQNTYTALKECLAIQGFKERNADL